MAELSTIARPYAKAAFQFALDADKLNEWSQMLQFVSEVVSEATVRKVLNDPVQTADKRYTLLAKICGEQIDADFQRYLSLLARNDRLPAIPSIAEQYEALKAAQERSVDVSITSAYPLNEKQTSVLVTALQKKLDRQVKIETTVDQSLIGGVIIRAGDMVIDSSVKGKLVKLAETVI